MSSNLTGDFDICAEVSAAVLTGFSAIQFDGKTLPSPINASVPLGNASVPVKGEVTLRVTTAALTIDPSAKSSATATIHCDDSALSISGLANSMAMPLSAIINVSGVPFAFVEAADKSEKTLELNFAAASVQAAITLDGTNLGRIETALAKAFDQQTLTPAEASAIPGALNQALTDAIKTTFKTLLIPGADFALVPSGKNGQIGPPLKFCDVEVATRPVAGAQPGVLAILGTLFADHGGIVAAKTVTATDKTHQGSVTISPDGFQSLFRNAAEKSKLPNGTTISNVTTALEQDKILLNLDGTSSGTGYSAAWAIGGHMTASIPGGLLTLDLTVDSQKVDPQIDWWVWLLLGPAAADLEVLASAEGPSQLQAFIPALQQDVHNATTVINGVLPNFTFDEVAVQTQGIIMQGTAPVPSGVSTEIAGMVTDPNEMPIAGATISYAPLNQVQATSDANGMYQFNAFALDGAFAPNSTSPSFSFPATPFAITATKGGYITTAQTVSLVSGQPVIRDFVMRPILPFALTGRVFGPGNAAIANATVTLSFDQTPPALAAQPVQTKADGSYTIANVNPGQWTESYTVTASAPGFVTGEIFISTVSNGQSVTSNITLVALHPFEIVVMVTGTFGPETDPTESSVANATVSASAPGQSFQAQNNGDGSYTIGNVNPGAYNGDYTVSVAAKDFISQNAVVSQPNGASTTVSVALARPWSKVPTPTPKPGTMM